MSKGFGRRGTEEAGRRTTEPATPPVSPPPEEPTLGPPGGDVAVQEPVSSLSLSDLGGGADPVATTGSVPEPPLSETDLLSDVIAAPAAEPAAETRKLRPNAKGRGGANGKDGAGTASRASIEDAKQRIQSVLMERIDIAAASQLPRQELEQQISEVVQEILAEQRIQLNLAEQRSLVTLLLNDMLGLGPLEPLLADETITDIMVNGPNQVYVERGGKLDLDRRRFPRQRPRHEHRDPDRDPDRPAHRRSKPPGRRAARGRQPCQHHHPAAGDRRLVHLDP